MDTDGPHALVPEDTHAALHSLLLSLENVDDFLQELSDLVGQLTTPPLSCGITVRYDGFPLTVASSDARARSLDETQYDAHEGPCLHAMQEGEVVHVADVATDDRWPSYVRGARERGLQASLSLPLIVSGRSVGAINLYSFDSTPTFDDETRRRAEVFAAQASTALLLTLRQIEASETNEQLEAALTSRSVIDQALGIVMGQQRCSSDEAFAMLRSRSQSANRKLRDVAEDLVRRATEPR